MQGIMQNLKDSSAYTIVNRYKSEFDEVKTLSVKNEGKRELAKDIALKMLAKGNSVELIREYTGLSIREMNKILKEIKE